MASLLEINIHTAKHQKDRILLCSLSDVNF